MDIAQPVIQIMVCFVLSIGVQLFFFDGRHEGVVSLQLHGLLGSDGGWVQKLVHLFVQQTVSLILLGELLLEGLFHFLLNVVVEEVGLVAPQAGHSVFESFFQIFHLQQYSSVQYKFQQIHQKKVLARQSHKNVNSHENQKHAEEANQVEVEQIHSDSAKDYFFSVIEHVGVIDRKGLAESSQDVQPEQEGQVVSPLVGSEVGFDHDFEGVEGEGGGEGEDLRCGDGYQVVVEIFFDLLGVILVLVVVVNVVIDGSFGGLAAFHQYFLCSSIHNSNDLFAYCCIIKSSGSQPHNPSSEVQLQLGVVRFRTQVRLFFYQQLASRGSQPGIWLHFLQSHSASTAPAFSLLFLSAFPRYTLLLFGELFVCFGGGRVEGRLPHFMFESQQFGFQLMVFCFQLLVLGDFGVDVLAEEGEVVAEVQEGSVDEDVLLVDFEPALGAPEGSRFLDEYEALLAVGVLSPADDFGFAGAGVVRVRTNGAAEVESFRQFVDDGVVGLGGAALFCFGREGSGVHLICSIIYNKSESYFACPLLNFCYYSNYCCERDHICSPL